MMGSGGMIVMDEDTCMVDTARYYLNFLSEESCGKCVPCREGIYQMLEVLNRITGGEGAEGDIELLEEISEVVKRFSLCALGGTAPNPVLSTIRHFRDEYEAHIYDKRCPSGVCKALISYYIDPEKCRACMACLQELPGGGDHRSEEGGARDRSGQVHQVRRLRGGLPVALRRGGEALRCSSTRTGRSRNPGDTQARWRR